MRGTPTPSARTSAVPPTPTRRGRGQPDPWSAPPVVTRLGDGPIIGPSLLPGADGQNIDGPCLVRVPPWVAKPLGRYYLYFAHHGGTFIRMAYGDALTGPWRIHGGGVLSLAALRGASSHVASPDVVVDHERREFRLYFHAGRTTIMRRPGVTAGGQPTFLALSRDGLAFEPSAPLEVLGPFYFRVFRHPGGWYAFAKGGELLRSDDGVAPFRLVGNPFFAGRSSGVAAGNGDYNLPGDVRHVAVDIRGDDLWVYFTRIGDAPERILRTRLPYRSDPGTWCVNAVQEVLRPEFPWEGCDLPLEPSLPGAGLGNALRDPFVYREEDRTYLLYCVRGESGIAIAELHMP